MCCVAVEGTWCHKESHSPDLVVTRRLETNYVTELNRRGALSRAFFRVVLSSSICRKPWWFRARILIRQPDKECVTQHSCCRVNWWASMVANQRRRFNIPMTSERIADRIRWMRTGVA